MKNQQTEQGNQKIIKIRTRSRAKQSPKLTLKVDTWQKVSHGLFDYQSPPEKISKEQITIQQSSRVFRNNITRKTCVRQLKQEAKSLPQRVQVFTVQYDPTVKNYLLKNSFSTNLSPVMIGKRQQSQAIVENNKLFVSLTKEGPGHKLRVGDFVKLGRVQLVALQINNSQKTESLDFQQIYGSKSFIFHLKENLQGSCKVCLTDEATQTDPLVNPCHCKGSCAVIHLNCLKNWINNKVKRQILGKVRTYNFQKHSCEICKAPFPDVIRLQNGDQTELLSFQRPNSPYILFQQCSQTQEKSGKILHFILPEQGNTVSIGRGQLSQLNISDISVSRNHSQVIFEKNQFLIHDLNSKFGTLIEMKHDISINTNIRLQHNGCSMNIQLKEDKKQRISKSGKKSQKNQ